MHFHIPGNMLLSLMAPWHPAIAATLLLAALTPPSFALDLQPEAFRTSPPLLQGPLSPNTQLERAEKLFRGQLPNPECIDILNGTLYTGLQDGRIVALEDGRVRMVVRVGGDDCDTKPSGCGRPNGLRFDKNGDLMVADASRGLYKVNVVTGAVSSLFSTQVPVNGTLAKGPNNLDVTREGDVYFSDTTTKWDANDSFYDFVEVAPNGRLLRYEASSKKTSAVLDRLYFPNGIQLSPDEDFLLIAQTSKYNILKYHLRGPKKGQLQVLLDNLPGLPDNIRVSPRGTFWVGLIGVRLPGNEPVMERLGPWPAARKTLGRLADAASAVLRGLAQGNPGGREEATYQAFRSKLDDLYLGPHYGWVLEFDASGRILCSLQSPSGHVHHISHALEVGGYLYLGSPSQNYIAKVALA